MTQCFKMNAYYVQHVHQPVLQIVTVLIVHRSSHQSWDNNERLTKLCRDENQLHVPTDANSHYTTFSIGCLYLGVLSLRSLFSHSTVSVELALPTSKMSASWCWILLLGALSVWLSVVTCFFLEQERRRSVDGVSWWLLQSARIRYQLTYDHH